MNSLGVSILFVLLLGIIFLPRRGALLALVTGVLYLTHGAGLEIAGMNLFPARFLGYAAFIRVLLRQEFSFKQLVGPDKAFIVLYLFVTSVLLIREQESSLLNIAKLLDNLLTYFAFRGLVRTPDEFRRLLKAMAVLLVPYVAIVAFESATDRNLFTLVGHHGKSWLREGTPRCFGSFRHPSLLGSLGACFLPLFIALVFDPRIRRRAIVGVIACAAIVVFSNSGGPVSVFMVAVIGWLLWVFRLRMQTFRRGFVASLILLALVMKAPIWYLPAKASIITGGSGWHRSRLMEVGYLNLENWWVFGMPIEETRGWMPYGLGATGGADITNQFLAYGLEGGLLAIALFIVVLYRAFSLLGRALQRARERGEKLDEYLLWGLGVALAAHIFNWLGITYYDQFYVIWLLQFAALVSLSGYWVRQSSESRRLETTWQENEQEGAFPSSVGHARA